MIPGSTLYRVIKEYRSPYPVSIPFAEGELVTTGEEFTEDPEWAGWIRCTADGGREAWCPLSYLDRTKGRARFLRPYDARELSVSEGEELLGGEILNGFVFARNGEGVTGWVPLNCLHRVDS